MTRLSSYVLHVRRTGPNVFRGDVPTLKRVDEPAMRAKDCFAISHLLVLQNNRLPTAQRKPRERVLVSHAARKPEHVVDRFLFVSITPETRAADGHAEASAVDRYQTVIPVVVGTRSETFVVRNRQFLYVHVFKKPRI